MAANNDARDSYIPPHARADKSITFLDTDDPNQEYPVSGYITMRKSVGEAKAKQQLTFNMSDEEEVDPPPTIVAMFNSLSDKMNNQINRLKKMDISAANTNKSLQYTQDSLKDLKTKVDQLKSENKTLKKENERYHRQTRDICRCIEDIEQKLEQNDHALRRKNILIEGVAESAGENVLDIAIAILKALKPDITKRDFEFVQRVSKPGGKRPILVVFMSVNERDQILRKKKDLKGNPNLRAIWLNEDANPTIKKQKNECRAVVREAQKQGLNAIQGKGEPG